EVTAEGDALADESVVSGQDWNHDEHVPSQHADSKQTLISASADAKASSNILGKDICSRSGKVEACNVSSSSLQQSSEYDLNRVAAFKYGSLNSLQR
ncbi:hypothetical protein Tsubulata_027116, partial [Turnera subulata]